MVFCSHLLFVCGEGFSFIFVYVTVLSAIIYSVLNHSFFLFQPEYLYRFYWIGNFRQWFWISCCDFTNNISFYFCVFCLTFTCWFCVLTLLYLSYASVYIIEYCFTVESTTTAAAEIRRESESTAVLRRYDRRLRMFLFRGSILTFYNYNQESNFCILFFTLVNDTFDVPWLNDL